MAPDWQTLNRLAFAGRLNLETARPVAGGDICDSYTVANANGSRYFVKFHSSLDLLECEFRNLQLLAATPMVTPVPIDCVRLSDSAALVLEYLEFGGRADESRLGELLASVHREQEPHGRYGLDYDNFIGHSRQENSWFDSWKHFWWQCRLEPQLAMAARNGHKLSVPQVRIKEAVMTRLAEHRPPASLLHGDLWGGNKGYLADGRPVIFDPACYYGDRETDLGFTRVFGGFSPEFYRSYQRAWSLPDGWQIREPVYNLYHMLNHLNLFGRGYLPQVERLCKELIR